jgi:hypothetical protein
MIFDLYNRCALIFYQIFCIPLQRTGIYLVYIYASSHACVRVPAHRSIDANDMTSRQGYGGWMDGSIEIIMYNSDMQRSRSELQVW